MHRTVALALLMVSVLSAGCSTPAGVASLAEPTAYPTYTPYPTLEPLPTYTPYPTYTPLPTHTAQLGPTPKPSVTSTPTATVFPLPELPASWVEYADVLEAFVLHHPPSWEVHHQTVNGVYFHLTRFGWAGIELKNVGRLDVHSEGAINEFTESVMAQQDELDTVRLLSKGIWDDPVPMIFVELSVTDYVYENTSHQYEVIASVAGGRVVRASIGRVAGRITEEELEEFQLAIATMRF